MFHWFYIRFRILMKSSVRSDKYELCSSFSHKKFVTEGYQLGLRRIASAKHVPNNLSFLCVFCLYPSNPLRSYYLG